MIKRIIAIAALLLVSCTSQSDKDAVVHVVKAYNIALTQAYRDLNTDYLKPVATKEEIDKMFAQILALEVAQSRMVAIQKEFEVVDIKVKKATATVRTRERWVYWWESIVTGEITREQMEEKAEIDYMLVKTGGSWRVSSLSTPEDAVSKGSQ